MKSNRFRDSEKIFWDALRDIFIGAEVEGISGYINLMRIKSKYFEKILALLKKDVEKNLEEFPNFRKELFDKLYSFFRRYFSKSGSIYFNTTPFSERIYERVYTDKDDVSLFWKTHMLYYVKTDRIFRSMKVDVDSFRFFFDVSGLETKKAWEKKEIVYELSGVRQDGTITIKVYYSEKGKKTKTDQIARDLKKKNVKIDEEILEKAFRIFERQSEVDYFLNKNAKDFLREQFDLWLYQYTYTDESTFTEKRIKQLKTLKDIAYKIIDFISQFEDELVRIWSKPKFVLKSNYVLTLDRLSSKEKGIGIIEKILNHRNFDEQIKEWKELGILDEDFKPKEILTKTLTGKSLNPKCQSLPLDTKYFKDIELEILSIFEHLDNELNGSLIKSENWQALNTILPKFKEKVQTIYIDPPFNKEDDADYFYSVKFKDATWITMLENRLKLARDLLKDTGGTFVRCDFNGNMYVRLLMNEIFGEENFRNEITIRKANIQGPIYRRFNPALESLCFYSKTESTSINPQYKKRKNEIKWMDMHSPKENVKRNEICINEEKFIAPKGRHWTFSQEKANQLVKENRIRIIEKEYVDVYGNKQTRMPQYLMSELEILDSNWTDIPGYSQTQGFPTENSEALLKRVIESTSNEDDLIMDFFLGSGTTSAVAHKLERKWIGVEMGEHFFTVILPRMKKVLAGDKSGISRDIDWQGGGFFAYYELEQFEDTLRRTKYEDLEPFLKPKEDPYNQYIFMKDLKMLQALEVSYKNNKVKVDLSKLYDGIDIPETLSNLLGKWIKKITEEYVEFEDGERANIKDLDYKLIKPLIWWEA